MSTHTIFVINLAYFSLNQNLPKISLWYVNWFLPSFSLPKMSAQAAQLLQKSSLGEQRKGFIGQATFAIIIRRGIHRCRRRLAALPAAPALSLCRLTTPLNAALLCSLGGNGGPLLLTCGLRKRREKTFAQMAAHFPQDLLIDTQFLELHLFDNVFQAWRFIQIIFPWKYSSPPNSNLICPWCWCTCPQSWTLEHTYFDHVFFMREMQSPSIIFIQYV